jgi:hypothetical protein
MVLSNPVKPGRERLEERLESGKEEKYSEGARLELQVIKESLTKVREEVDAGLARLDAVIEAMDSFGPSLGHVEMKQMGRGKERAEDGHWVKGVKPKKKKTKKKLVGFEGPKTGRSSGTILWRKSPFIWTGVMPQRLEMAVNLRQQGRKTK